MDRWAGLDGTAWQFNALTRMSPILFTCTRRRRDYRFIVTYCENAKFINILNHWECMLGLKESILSLVFFSWADAALSCLGSFLKGYWMKASHTFCPLDAILPAHSAYTNCSARSISTKRVTSCGYIQRISKERRKGIKYDLYSINVTLDRNCHPRHVCTCFL